MMNMPILLSTTSNLEGYKIVEYIDYIDCSENIGSGFMTDDSAFWADFFGDSSYAINHKLDKLKKIAMNKLQEKCLMLGGNAIIGFHIDIDEISSHQRMIFMVTVSGTAVRVIRDVAYKETEINGTKIKLSIEGKRKTRDALQKLSLSLKNTQCLEATTEDEIKALLINMNLFVSGAGLEDQLVDCLLSYVKLCSNNHKYYLKEETELVFLELNNSDLTIGFLNYIVNGDNDKRSLLELRKSKPFIGLCEILGKVADYSVLFDYLNLKNEYLNTIVIYPILNTFKLNYTYEDSETIFKILQLLKSRFYTEDNKSIQNLIDTKQANLYKLSEDGSLVKKESQLNSQDVVTINIATYIYKLQLISHLESIYKELKNFF